MGICGSKASATGASNGATTTKADKDRIESKGGIGRANFILSNRGTLLEFYDVEKRKLGQGSYGSVCKATNKSTGALRAVKTISKSQVKNIDRFKQEIEIMKQLDHPNIIKLFETFEDHRNIYLVMELCTGGELFDRIIDHGHFTEQLGAVIMQQMLRSVYYMHENHIMHRDLKPENFLFLTKEAIEQSSLKLIDFGLSTRFADGQMMSTKAGTPYYVAPQVLQGRYDKACDVWSTGVIMYVLLCGYPPFYGDSDADVLAKVRLGNYSFNASDWKYISEDAKDLIRRQLKMNPAERFTAEQCLNHIWIKNKAPKSHNVPLQSNVMDNLRTFRSQNKLKKAALQVIASQLDEGQISDLKKLFVSLDKNGDGQLTPAEITEGLRSSGMEIPGDLKTIMMEVDADGSGVIDYTEFIAATVDKKKYMQEDVCWAAFRVFDRDGNGTISKQELAQIIQAGEMEGVADETSIQEIIEEVDANGDGEIDFQEFMEMMRKQSTG